MGRLPLLCDKPLLMSTECPQRRGGKRAALAQLIRWTLSAASLGGALLTTLLLLQAARLLIGSMGVQPALAISPLPTYGQLATFELADHQGQLLGTRQLRGSTHILQWLSTTDAPSSRAALERLAALRARLAERSVPVRLVAVDLAPSTPAARARLASMGSGIPQGVPLLGGAVEPLLRQALALLPQGTVPAECPGPGCHLEGSALLIDHAGGLRGFYALASDEQALERLVEDARCLSECGPVPAVVGLVPGARLSTTPCQLIPRQTPP